MTTRKRGVVLMWRWADATRHQRWDEASRLWKLILDEWQSSAPTEPTQEYWNDLLERRMAVLERRERRRAVDDDEFDKLHEDVNR